MTFKKKSELDKDNATNVDSESKDISSIKKKRERIAWIVGVFIIALIAFWAITTIVIPLNRSSGAEKYSGDFRELAENVYDFESSYDCDNGCNTDFNELYKIYIDDVRLTTDEERVKYCTDYPERMTTDPNRTTSYTVVVSKQYLGSLSKQTYGIVGCVDDIPNRWYLK